MLGRRTRGAFRCLLSKAYLLPCTRAHARPGTHPPRDDHDDGARRRLRRRVPLALSLAHARTSTASKRTLPRVEGGEPRGGFHRAARPVNDLVRAAHKPIQRMHPPPCGDRSGAWVRPGRGAALRTQLVGTADTGGGHVSVAARAPDVGLPAASLDRAYVLDNAVEKAGNIVARGGGMPSPPQRHRGEKMRSSWRSAFALVSLSVFAVCALAASAGTATGASLALTSLVPRVGTGGPQTGGFTPSGSGDVTDEEFAGEPEGEEGDQGPEPFGGQLPGFVSLSKGSGSGVSVSSSAKAKSDPEFQTEFEGLNLFQQRYARGGNQFTVEPPDQGLCVGNGYVVEAVNDVINVFNASGQSVLPDNTSTKHRLRFSDAT